MMKEMFRIGWVFLLFIIGIIVVLIFGYLLIFIVGVGVLVIIFVLMIFK